MQTLIVDLTIAREEFMKLYYGQAQSVRARAIDGRSVQFPASVLRKYVSHRGVRGRFEFIIDEAGVMQSLRRLQE